MVFLILFCTQFYAFQVPQSTDLDKQFLKAVKLAEFTKITELHKAGADLNKQDASSGLTPLSWAVLRGNTKLTQLLLDLGANVNVQDNKGDSLLHLGASMRKTDISEILIKKKIDLGLVNRLGNTAIHSASISGATGVTSLILEQGISIESKGEKGRTPLILATLYQQLGSIRFLLKRGANMNTPDEGGNSAWDYASTVNEVELLIANGAKANQRNAKNPPKIFQCIENSNEPLVSYLIGHGADLNIQNHYGWTPLMLCDILGKKEIQETLEKNGAVALDSSAASNGNLAYFSAKGDINRVRQILQSQVDGFDIDYPTLGGSSPLLLATEYGNSAICELLLEKGAFIDFQNSKGWNALMYAADTKNESILDLLFQLGADPSKKSNRGETLYYFVQARSLPPEILQVLEKWGLHPQILPCCD